MQIIIDTERRELVCQEAGQSRSLPLYSPEAFDLISRQWLKVGWSLKYSYSYSWLGRPIIQLPEDVLRVQEVIFATAPDVIIETGVAHGGSLIFYASLFKVMGKGRVIGVDLEIRPHNRQAIEAHSLAPLITLVEGNSVAPTTLDRVRSLLHPGEKVLVILDSCHTRQHVAAELAAYSPLVTPGSYIVATDGIMRDLSDLPTGRPEWAHENPWEAARDFAQTHPEFDWAVPPRPFDESQYPHPLTYWPGAWLRRLHQPSADRLMTEPLPPGDHQGSA